jgi:Rieske Fe-S protein
MNCDAAPGGCLSRKQFLLLTAAAVTAAGCEYVSPGAGSVASRAGRVIDAGPGSNYAAEGLYASFLSQGFFLVRRRGQLVALSSYCTHRHCKLTPEADRSFYCDCHGSTFDPGGKVTKGPATRDLPQLPLSIDAAGHVLVTVV